MSPELIEAVRARALDPETRIDNFPLNGPGISPPLTDAQLAESVERLGFEPAPDVVTLYRAVGNGGFGPHYGLMGLAGGADNEDGTTAVDRYEEDRRPQPDFPGWAWPERLLAISDLGCAMFLCLDCTNDDGRLVVFEPGLLDETWNTESTLFPMTETLSDWLALWIEGEDTWARIEAAMASSAN